MNLYMGLLLWIFLEALPQASASNLIPIELVQIPAGKYWVGCDKSIDKTCSPAEQPGRFIESPSFKMGKFEITQMQFEECVKSGNCFRSKKIFPKEESNSPITDVTWSQAQQFCKWRKMDLPTEVQWEISARGPDRRIYAWGNIPPTCDTANSSYLCKSKIKPVGSYEKDQSPFGAYDMVGNIEEWVVDWYDEQYLTHYPLPALDKKPSERSVRGGSYRSDTWHSRITHRFYALPSDVSGDRGFRCASAN